MVRKRWLVPPLRRFEDPEQAVAHFVARYPGAEVHSDQMVLDFIGAAQWLDDVSPQQALLALGQAGVRVPAALQGDNYATGRYLFHRWQDPDLRAAVMSAFRPEAADLIRLRKRTPLPELCALFDRANPLLAVWYMQQAGLGERIEAVLAALSPERAARYRADFAFRRALLHRFITQPDLAERQPTRAEQRELIRRIGRRNLRLHNLRRSLYALGRERKALVGRIRQAERAAEAELAALERALAQTRQELAAAEMAHAAAMANLAARHAAERADLEARAEAMLQDFAAALAERQAWAAAVQLQGELVAVVGDTARAAGYRVLVESAGGRFVHVSAVEKLNRVGEAVVGADVIILIAACATHAAERLLRKAARSDALILRCPQAGLAAFERVLRKEVLLRRGLSAGRRG